MADATLNINDEPVLLRAMELSDLERNSQWHNDKELYEMLVGTFRYVSLRSETQWLEKKVAHNSTECNLAICEKVSGKHIGNIYLHGIDWISRNARMGIFIGDRSCRGKGYGQSAVRQLVDYAFNHLNLVRIYFTLLAENTAAKKCYEKCGFTTEGILRKHVFKGGSFHDSLMMGLCRADI